MPVCRTFSYLEKQQQSARDFAKFLELAPRDNRNRPDAYYALSLNAAMTKDMATAKRRSAWEGSSCCSRLPFQYAVTCIVFSVGWWVAHCMIVQCM